MKTALTIGVLVAGVWLAAPAMAAEPGPPARLAAIVGGRPITQGVVAAGLRRRGIARDRATSAMWQQQLRSAVDRALLADAARAEMGRAARRLSDEQLARIYLRRRFAATLHVSPREVEQWYDDHKDTLARGEIRIARVITIGPNPPGRDTTTAERNRFLRQTESLRQEILAGDDFEAAARKHSIDPYAARGGLLPPVRETRAANFAAEVFKVTKPGEVGGVFETPYGFHIVRLDEVQPGRLPPLTEVYDRIKTRLQDQKWAEHVEPHLVQLRSRADIRIMKSALPGSDADRLATQPRPAAAD